MSADILVDERDEQINTTHRYNHYYRKVAKDGRTCSLYHPHVGKHKPKHGTENDRFGDDE